MLNKKALLLAVCGALSGGSAEQTIGAAGQQGFGVGPYGGDEADLIAMGLSPMDGCYDITSDNYGNYLHTNGSVMCFIPAFCYRIGNSAAPSYSRDTKNALEIRYAQEFESFVPGAAFTSANMGDGWILHRAFVDGGVVKRGFFIDKYLCSNQNGVAASVKGADWLMCYNDASKTYYTKSLGGDCIGQAYDAITLSRARGDQYALVTCYQWSAIAMISLAHGQAATSADACAWYDSAHTKNFPKGNTNQLKDYNDSSLTFTTHTYGSPFAKTGTCSNFAKSTHNGQNNGVADVAGMCNQWVIGATNYSSAKVYLMKTSIAAHDVTKDNVVSSSIADTMSVYGDGGYYFAGSPALSTGTRGTSWAQCGVIPPSKVTSANNLFGGDEYREYYGSTVGLKVGLGYSWGSTAGVWCRSFSGFNAFGSGYWFFSTVSFGFRASGYAS